VCAILTQQVHLLHGIHPDQATSKNALQPQGVGYAWLENLLTACHAQQKVRKGFGSSKWLTYSLSNGMCSSLGRMHLAMRSHKCSPDIPQVHSQNNVLVKPFLMCERPAGTFTGSGGMDGEQNFNEKKLEIDAKGILSEH